MLPLLVALALTSGTGTHSPAPCPQPKVDPVVELTDMISYRPGEPAQLASDSLCELYCGVEVRRKSDSIPLCASFDCKFTLTKPDGTELTAPYPIGPTADGSPQAIGSGSLCTGWSSDLMPGWYTATLDCTGSRAPATLSFNVVRSHAGGFSIPNSAWRGENHCPDRPIFDETPLTPRCGGHHPGVRPGGAAELIPR
jgi:hypothetical protein